MKIALPYLKKIADHEPFSSSDLDEVARELLAKSSQLPCYLVVSSDLVRCCLFFREKQIYAAGRVSGDQFSDLTIRDFLLAVNKMSSPTASSYEVNSKILHSLLILFQKKPTYKVLTSMVDLDEVLDKIEEEGKSCIVSAVQGSFLAVLRYERGEVTALCHKQSFPAPSERSYRDDFLVKIYTLSAETALSINVYEDLLVKYASDAKMIEDDFHGGVSELFLSKPPILTLEFKGHEIGHWVMDKPLINIGRTAENDIVIDNLAVSRLHAVLEKDKGNYFVRDCDSLNGTALNGKPVGRARLQPGDEIIIGKHSLKFRRQTGMDMPAVPNPVPFDQTIIMGPGMTPPPRPQPVETERHSASGPRLVEQATGDIVCDLSGERCRIGRGSDADIEIGGLFIAGEHAEIVRENGDFVIRHLNGRRKVSVSGKPIKEQVLKDKDSIKIGKRQFIFQE